MCSCLALNIVGSVSGLYREIIVNVLNVQSLSLKPRLIWISIVSTDNPSRISVIRHFLLSPI